MKRCAAFSVVLTACLFPSVGDLTGGSSDGGGGDVLVGGDAPIEAGPTGPVTLASAGNVSAATGNAQQTHVIWAVNAKRWWLFYIDNDNTHLKTRSSADFAVWTDGPSLGLTHSNAAEGRNFTVSYASLGGADVVHVSFSHAESSKLSHTHTRGVINGVSIAWGTPIEVCNDQTGPSGPDGPATLVTTNGDVWDATGFVISQSSTAGHYNEDMFHASATDNGSSWSATFAQTTIEIVPKTSNNRAIIQGVVPVAFWEKGDSDPLPSNVHISSFITSWSSPADVFGQDAPQDPNDWDAVALASGEVHVVRALQSGGYEHVLGTTSIAIASPPATTPRTTGSGVVLLADRAHLAVFDLGSDGSVQESKWSGAQFSTWATIAPARTRAFLSGHCPDLDAHPEAGGCALVWTEPASGGFAIVGTLVQTR
jgi:hypothetical protein